jgi:cyclic beta-1,2-glucan synthetase
MFEYLMPILLMRNYEGTLLDQSYHAVVRAQIAYAAQKHVPWGISESGYYAFDANLNYQYHAFGAPELALKRGMAADLVISPYASILALPIDARAVLQNTDWLKKLDALSTYGLYEAIDYTANHLALGQSSAVVREYMAHHQGMILLTLVNTLLDNVMIRRFHADPRVQSVELLLQEQIPTMPTAQQVPPMEGSLVPPELTQNNVAPWSAQTHTSIPQVHFLSNGHYGVLITSAGSGFSQWESSALTRWRSDTTLDDWGAWVYVRDNDDGLLWSAGYQPTNVKPDSQSVLFYANKAELQRRDHDISLLMEITVPPDEDVEIRRVTLTNHSNHVRHLTVSSYGEVVLAAQETDRRHPAFNKMFIESEYLESVRALLFSRRLRSAHDAPLHMMHTLVLESQSTEGLQYETDRRAFLGRGKTPYGPEALLEGDGLAGTVGATLDPIMALGHKIALQPYESVQLAYVTGAGDSREKVLALATMYRQWSNVERGFDQARYQSELELRQLDLDTPQLERIQKLLASLLYPYRGFRAPTSSLIANTTAQSGLWTYGISGDYPILLVRIGDESELGLVSELLQAHTYWRNRQIKITLVILNQRDTGYLQELYNQVHRLIVRSGSVMWVNRHDGLFVLRADQLDEAGRILLETAARVYLDGSRGTLSEQIDQGTHQRIPLPQFVPPFSEADTHEPTPPLPRPTDLQFDNEYGGFSADGREYVITVEPGKWTPAPWINVIANPDFGFFVSETGSGMTWAGNSSEFRLTSWRNDPVSDVPSEAIYLRDEETAEIWSPTPLPAGVPEPYIIRHGHGYSIFEHHSHGLKQELGLSVVQDAPVKIIRLRLENTWNRTRRITVTYYAELVLGTTRDTTQQYLIPGFDTEHQTLFVHNPYSMEFGETHAFITASKNFHGLTTDRAEFLGRMGSLRRPAALGRIGLSSSVQAGDDPCTAVQVHVDLPPGAAEEIFFLIGVGENRQKALELAVQYRNAEQITYEWQKTIDFWKDLTSTITVKTPDSAMNVVLPWLLYQTLSCRIWGRSALYQSSGAFGFRDQLQDSMALLYALPDLAREHILRAARYQFEAGDVLHWWHPPSGRGVRTRFSDDLLWLPYVVAEYIHATGDAAILEEQVSFLKGEPLKPEEEERYGFYESTTETYSLYEHCRRALAKGTTAGAHGLPLMGTGDWNDGMNRVGVNGRGESVWMGWFLYAVMERFMPFFERAGDQTQADHYRRRMAQLQQAIEQNAWDGKWYIRAYYDDGTPLGSSKNEECRIDSIAQSWSMLSSAGDPSRARQAMESVDEYLVKPDAQLLLLFTPPFNNTVRDPGYIKGYVPGIRENGGQYTHAALWTVWAFAQMGQGNRAEALFRLLNPIYHSDTAQKAETYRVEPYVVAADVYSVPPYVGRGGWTWYTGSSGWMYRLGVTALLGLSRQGETLEIDPCIPQDWRSFELTYRYKKTVYQIFVENPDEVCKGVREIMLDGDTVNSYRIVLVDDGREHNVKVSMGMNH